MSGCPIIKGENAPTGGNKRTIFDQVLIVEIRICSVITNGCAVGDCRHILHAQTTARIDCVGSVVRHDRTVNDFVDLVGRTVTVNRKCLSGCVSRCQCGIPGLAIQVQLNSIVERSNCCGSDILLQGNDRLTVSANFLDSCRNRSRSSRKGEVITVGDLSDHSIFIVGVIVSSKDGGFLSVLKDTTTDGSTLNGRIAKEFSATLRIEHTATNGQGRTIEEAATIKATAFNLRCTMTQIQRCVTAKSTTLNGDIAGTGTQCINMRTVCTLVSIRSKCTAANDSRSTVYIDRTDLGITIAVVLTISGSGQGTTFHSQLTSSGNCRIIICSGCLISILCRSLLDPYGTTILDSCSTLGANLNNTVNTVGGCINISLAAFHGEGAVRNQEHTLTGTSKLTALDRQLAGAIVGIAALLVFDHRIISAGDHTGLALAGVRNGQLACIYKGIAAHVDGLAIQIQREILSAANCKICMLGIDSCFCDVSLQHNCVARICCSNCLIQSSKPLITDHCHGRHHRASLGTGVGYIAAVALSRFGAIGVAGSIVVVDIVSKAMIQSINYPLILSIRNLAGFVCVVQTTFTSVVRMITGSRASCSNSLGLSLLMLRNGFHVGIITQSTGKGLFTVCSTSGLQGDLTGIFMVATIVTGRTLAAALGNVMCLCSTDQSAAQCILLLVSSSSSFPDDFLVSVVCGILFQHFGVFIATQLAGKGLYTGILASRSYGYRTGIVMLTNICTLGTFALIPLVCFSCADFVLTLTIDLLVGRFCCGPLFGALMCSRADIGHSFSCSTSGAADLAGTGAGLCAVSIASGIAVRNVIIGVCGRPLIQHGSLAEDSAGRTNCVAVLIAQLGADQCQSIIDLVMLCCSQTIMHNALHCSARRIICNNSRTTVHIQIYILAQNVLAGGSLIAVIENIVTTVIVVQADQVCVLKGHLHIRLLIAASIGEHIVTVGDQGTILDQVIRIQGCRAVGNIVVDRHCRCSKGSHIFHLQGTLVDINTTAGTRVHNITVIDAGNIIFRSSLLDHDGCTHGLHPGVTIQVQIDGRVEVLCTANGNITQQLDLHIARCVLIDCGDHFIKAGILRGDTVRCDLKAGLHRTDGNQLTIIIKIILVQVHILTDLINTALVTTQEPAAGHSQRTFRTLSDRCAISAVSTAGNIHRATIGLDRIAGADTPYTAAQRQALGCIRIVHVNAEALASSATEEVTAGNSAVTKHRVTHFAVGHTVDVEVFAGACIVALKATRRHINGTGIV